MSPQRTCPNGHVFMKTSDCPTCPRCEAARAPKEGWLSVFSAPARSALEHAGITTVKKLAQHTRKEVLALHGMGPASLPNLQAALDRAGLSFKAPPPKAAKQAVGKGTARIDDYLKSLPKDKRDALQKLRKQILAAAPGAEEHFGYGLPGFKYNGHPMLYIGAAKHHCALYGSVPPGFKEQLKDFKTSKGTIQFTPEKPLSASLVKAIVKEKVAAIELRWPTDPPRKRK